MASEDQYENHQKFSKVCRHRCQHNRPLEVGRGACSALSLPKCRCAVTVGYSCPYLEQIGRSTSGLPETTHSNVLPKSHPTPSSRAYQFHVFVGIGPIPCYATFKPQAKHQILSTAFDFLQLECGAVPVGRQLSAPRWRPMGLDNGAMARQYRRVVDGNQ